MAGFLSKGSSGAVASEELPQNHGKSLVLLRFVTFLTLASPRTGG
jgi:hypothetical protein